MKTTKKYSVFFLLLIFSYMESSFATWKDKDANVDATLKRYLIQRMAFLKRDYGILSSTGNMKYYSTLSGNALDSVLLQNLYGEKVKDTISIANENTGTSVIRSLLQITDLLKKDRTSQIKKLLESNIKQSLLAQFSRYMLALYAIKEGKYTVADTYINDEDNTSSIMMLKISNLAHKGKMQAAQQLYNKLYPTANKKIYKNTISLDPKYNFSTLLITNFPNSVPLLKVAHYLTPSDKTIRTRIGQILLKQDNKEALKIFVKTLPMDKEGIALRIALAEKLSADKNTIKQAKEILQTLPKKNALTLWLKGKLLYEEKKYREALNIYLSLLANKTFTKSWNFYFTLGYTYDKVGNLEKAKYYLRKAVTASNETPYVVNYLAYTQINNNTDIESSLQMLKKAYDKEPDDYIADSLGWAYFKLGKLRKAIVYLEKSSETMSTNGEVNSHLAEAYFAVGRKHEALIHWKRALELDKDNEEIDVNSIKRKIKRLESHHMH